MNGEKLLSDVEEGLILSSDSPFDFHDEVFVFPIILKYLQIGWNTK